MKKIKKIVRNVAKKDNIIGIFFYKLLLIYRKLRYLIYKYKYEVDDGIILIEVTEDYNGIVKNIYETLIYNEKYDGFQLILAVKDVKKVKKYIKEESTKILKYKSKSFYKFSSKAKYRIINNNVLLNITPKKEQVIVLLKEPKILKENKIEKLKEKKIRNYIKKYVNIKAYDFKTSQSKKEMIELKNYIQKKYKLDEDKKKILYKIYLNNCNEYYLEDYFGKDKMDKLYKKYGSKFQFLIDTNFELPYKYIYKYKSFLIDVSREADQIKEIICDLFVTNNLYLYTNSNFKTKDKLLYSNYRKMYSKIQKEYISLYNGCVVDELFNFIDNKKVNNNNELRSYKYPIIIAKLCEKIIVFKLNTRKTMSMQWVKRNIIVPIKDSYTKFMGYMRVLFFPCSQNFKTLKTYKNKYNGKRCFLVGNGPSLTFNDLDLIKDEITFGCNLIYKIYNKTEWKPTFHCLADGLYAKKIGEELVSNICCDTFAVESVEKHLRKYRGNYKTILLKSIRSPKNGNYKVISPMAYHYPGGTVMSMMLCLAMYMGFKEIYLIGVDCTSSLSSSGHFIKGYMNDNIRRLDMKRIAKRLKKNIVTEEEVAKYYYDRVIYVYDIIEKYAQKNNIKIYNSTRGGALEVYERKQLEDVLKERGE